MSTFLTLTLCALLPTEAPKQRERNPFAPSLPQLTEAEEAKLDQIINRFILYDIGQLKGAEGIKALRDFQRLGPEAIPALIRGLNKSANINHSCPALVIARKLNGFVSSTKDIKLLQFLRDEVGAGVGRSRHAAVLQDLRVKAMLRKNRLIRQGVVPLTADGKKEPAYMSTGELKEAVKKDSGFRLKKVIVQLGNRKGTDAIDGLRLAVEIPQSDINSLARGALLRNLKLKQTADVVQDSLKDNNASIRQAAIRAAYSRKLRVVEEYIELLLDSNYDVADLAHRALVKIARKDFGPSKAANESERKQAVEKWRAWWRSRR